MKADADGRAWLIVGTDSGFEGLTAVYYARIAYTLTGSDPSPATGGSSLPGWAMAYVLGFGAVVIAAGVALLVRRLRSRA